MHIPSLATGAALLGLIHALPQPQPVAVPVPAPAAAPECGAVELRHTSPSQYNPLLARGVCRRDDASVAEALVGYYTGNAKMGYAIDGGAVAFSVCKIVNHNTGSTQPCSAYALGVAAVIDAILRLAAKANTGATGVATQGRREEHAQALLEAMSSSLLNGGFQLGATEILPVVARRDDDDAAVASPTVAAAFVIRDVIHPDDNVTNADFTLTAFEDGTGTLQVKHVLAAHATADDAATNTNATLTRRYGAAGFKYNYRVDYLDNAARTADISGVSVAISGRIAQQWAWAAENTALDQYFGAVGIDYILLKLLGVGIRIIAELSGFGEEYEDIGICGDMTRPIHDELR